MLFKDSCVTEMTPWRIREESTALPLNIFPAYVGSGDMIISLDPSGLQGLNHGVQHAFGCVPDAGDLYVVKQGMVGNVISKNNLLPLGFLEWEILLDGERIDSSNLSMHTSMWEREIFIDESRVVTKMLLNTHLTVEITAWIPFGTTSPVFEVRLNGYDSQNKPIKTPRNVSFGIFLNMTTRQGKYIYDKCNLLGDMLNLEVQGHENYSLNLKFTDSASNSPVLEGNRYGTRWITVVGNETQKLNCMFSFSDRNSIVDIENLRVKNSREWHAHYKKLASVKGVDLKETFLYHNSLYLLKLGFNYDFGIQIGVPFFQPWCWCASTFWDSHFIIDGLMRAGDRENAQKFLGFLIKTMKKHGKPFPWMCLYDGTSTIDDSRDFAPLVIAAHAMSAVKFQDYYRDPEMLREKVFPICKATCDYAIENLFSKVDGKWILSTPVSNDVVDEQAAEVNQTFTILWFLVIIKMTFDYARTLEVMDNLDSRYEDILRNYYIEHNENEYLHSRGMTAEEFHGASWLPFLLYPTEGMPFIDMGLMDKTRAKYCFVDLYKRKQGDYQPWTEFMQASSDFRRGDIEAGYNLRQIGIGHAFGPGFFSEVGPRQETCGLPPYVSAHGSYITSFLYQFISTSIWEKEIGLFSCLPAVYRGNNITIRDIICSGAITVCADYGTYELSAKFDGDLSGFSVKMLLPPGLKQQDISVFVDGCAVRFDFLEKERIVEIKLDSVVKGCCISLK